MTHLLAGGIDGCALARVGFCYTLLNGIVNRELADHVANVTTECARNHAKLRVL
jgi:hypothetical protein